MRRGDFEAAWRETDRFEEVARRAGEPTLLWDGTPLAGRKVLVRCLHGLGDTLQFSRFLHPLRAIAAETHVIVQPDLSRLLRSQGDLGIVSPEATIRDAVEIEIMELAYAFRATPATLPEPRLSLPGPRDHGRKSCKVAIFWSASGWGGGRYLPLSSFDRLGTIPGAEFFSFQQGRCESEAESSPLAMRRLSAHTTDILDLARALLGMDLVIAVDTMAAHLAGSLRLPVWLLLERKADWRWMEGRDRSPWYPEMQIFRETEKGWAAPLARLRGQLSDFASRDEGTKNPAGATSAPDFPA